jgi:hypothetical protein
VSKTVLVCAGIALGAVAVFGGAYGVDAYRSWRYHFRHTRELRERPIVPEAIMRLEIERHPDFWLIRAYGRANQAIDWETGGHPMDAVRHLIEEMQP